MQGRKEQACSIPALLVRMVQVLSVPAHLVRMAPVFSIPAPLVRMVEGRTWSASVLIGSIDLKQSPKRLISIGS